MPVAELPSVDLHYMQLPCEAKAPEPCKDLVMIHGLGASLAFWHLGVASPLRSLCRVTAYDLRGHGRSKMPPTGYSTTHMVDDLERLLDHLGIAQAHLAAHSFGGTIAVLFALRHPERVASLILADVRLRAIQPQQRLRDWSHWPHWRMILRRAGIELDEDDPEGGYQMLVEMARLQLHHPQLARHLPRLFGLIPGGRRKGGVARRWLRLQEATSIRRDFLAGDDITEQQLRTLKQPILALYGEYSPTLPTAYALEQLCPNVYLHIIKKAGHFFPLTQPKRLVRACTRFLSVQQHPQPRLLDDLAEVVEFRRDGTGA
jgi:pimeloyl-ACP methyl ester carboxylesterase